MFMTGWGAEKMRHSMSVKTSVNKKINENRKKIKSLFVALKKQICLAFVMKNHGRQIN